MCVCVFVCVRVGVDVGMDVGVQVSFVSMDSCRHVTHCWRLQIYRKLMLDALTSK